jgi:hypothetical protein
MKIFPVIVVITFLLIGVVFNYWMRKESMRLVHGWLAQNGYSTQDSSIKFPGGVWPTRAIFEAVNSQGEKFKVVLRLGSYWSRSFLSVAECMSIEKQ